MFALLSLGATGKLVNNLSDDAQIRMTLASSAFRSVTEKFLNGDIQIKTLNQIFDKENEFAALLKIGEYKYLFLLYFFFL